MTRSYFHDAVVAALGEHAAETVVFGEVRTGPGADIDRATAIVRRMVTEFGISERLGTVAFGRKQQMIFLRRDIRKQRDCGGIARRAQCSAELPWTSGGGAPLVSRQSRHRPPTRTRTLRHTRQMPICGLVRFIGV